ncbi:Hypothetical predicted protein [Podarcis lilfordi]|uniref:Uncharacterized protein n=1 Tax=Podarcis lilfordi TaxID=74358 RepID=A0AA35KB12_9SAUR|nr:Hypothetical predicted protein [Podarcis lilfordi]
MRGAWPRRSGRLPKRSGPAASLRFSSRSLASGDTVARTENDTRRGRPEAERLPLLAPPPLLPLLPPPPLLGLQGPLPEELPARVLRSGSQSVRPLPPCRGR